MRELASRICRDYLTGAWKTISASALNIQRIRYFKLGFISFFIYKNFYFVCSGGLSNFLYYVSLPDDIESCNNVKNIKRARKDTSLQEPKEVGFHLCNFECKTNIFRKIPFQTQSQSKPN